MVDQINESIDVVVRWMDGKPRKGDDDEEPMIVNISAYKANERPLYQITQKGHMETIRRELEERSRLLLTVYNTYAYYSCARTEMQQKVLDHMTSTGAYCSIMTLNDSNQHLIEKVVKRMDKRITLTLDKLLAAQLITSAHYNTMKVNPSKRRLDTLYFLPDTRRVSLNVNVAIVFSTFIRIGRCSISSYDCLSLWINNADFTLSVSSSSTHVRSSDSPKDLQYRC
jgi:hypothetical protein